MSENIELFDTVYGNALRTLTDVNLSDEETAAAMKNLKVLSECRPLVTPEPEATPEPDNTVLGKLKAGVARVWDNETTRVLIKAGGAFAGVAYVTYASINRDSVVLREGLSQANQRNN